MQNLRALSLFSFLSFVLVACSQEEEPTQGFQANTTPITTPNVQNSTQLSDAVNCYDGAGDVNEDGLLNYKDCMGEKGEPGEKGDPGEPGINGMISEALRPKLASGIPTLLTDNKDSASDGPVATNNTGSNVFISGSIQFYCTGPGDEAGWEYLAADMYVKWPNEDWQLYQHYFKDGAQRNLRYSIGLILPPEAKIRFETHPNSVVNSSACPVRIQLNPETWFITELK